MPYKDVSRSGWQEVVFKIKDVGEDVVSDIRVTQKRPKSSRKTIFIGPSTEPTE